MSKKPTAIFYLSDRSLIIQTEKSVLVDVAFPKEIVADGEIIDSKAFEEFLIQEIRSSVKKVDVGVILLGSGLLYQRSVDKQEDILKAKEGLHSSIPFDKKYISEKIIKTESKTYLLATHKLFYQGVIKACEKSGITIMAVLPLSLFSDEEIISTIDKKIIHLVLTKEELYERGDFLVEEQEVSSAIEKTDQEVLPEEIVDGEKEIDSLLPHVSYKSVQAWNTTRLVLVLGFLIALTVILGGLIYLQLNRFQSSGQVAKQAPVSVTTPSPSEVPKEISKSELKVVIENGTGTAGQAGEVKALFEELDYTIIETSNAELSDHEKTEVVFSSKVSKLQQQEIKDLLLENFTAVTSNIDPTAVADIVVITGVAK